VLLGRGSRQSWHSTSSRIWPAAELELGRCRATENAVDRVRPAKYVAAISSVCIVAPRRLGCRVAMSGMLQQQPWRVQIVVVPVNVTTRHGAAYAAGTCGARTIRRRRRRALRRAFASKRQPVAHCLVQHPGDQQIEERRWRRKLQHGLGHAGDTPPPKWVPSMPANRT
jgi:hypothetical protein